MNRNAVVSLATGLGLIGLLCLWGPNAHGDDPKGPPADTKSKLEVNRKAVDRLLTPAETKPPAPVPVPIPPPAPAVATKPASTPTPKVVEKPKEQPKAKTAAKKKALAKALAKADLAAKNKSETEAKPKAEPPKPKDTTEYGRPARTVRAPTLTSAALDEKVTSLVTEAGIKPVERTSDDEFIRRVYIDLIGTLPTPVQIGKFRSAGGPNKREKLIDELLASPKFGENWAAYWRDVIATRATNQNPGRLEGYKDLENWLAEQFNKDRPWDEIATRMITAAGKSDDEGAVGMMLAHLDGGKVAEVEVAGEVARVFLGLQIQCAQCHDHPSDQWKRDQFHGFAAFFAGVRAKAGAMQAAAVENSPRAAYAMPDLKDPTKKVPVAPRFFLDTSAGTIPKDAPPEVRRALAASRGAET